MKQFLVPILIVLLGLGSSVTAYFLGRKSALTALQTGLRQIAIASQKQAAKPDPEDEILQDPPEVIPVEAEQQAEISLEALEAMRETSEPGSLRFDNPDVVNLLADRERRLRELEERLKLEMQNLNVATQWIASTRLSQDQLLASRLKYIDEEEQLRLQEHARRLVSLNPTQAISILTNFTPNEIARTLLVVGSTNSASLLAALVASGPDGPKNAAEISKIMMRLTTRPAEAVTNAPPGSAK
jgi:hypothetical protein